jgi:hypothetical protein
MLKGWSPLCVTHEERHDDAFSGRIDRHDIAGTRIGIWSPASLDGEADNLLLDGELPAPHLRSLLNLFLF